MNFGEVKNILEKNGYVAVRNKGVSIQFKNPCGLAVLVPNRDSNNLPVGLIRALEKTTGLSF